MSELKTKVAYLQGLSEGIDLNLDTKEGRLLQGIIEVLEDFADTMDNIEDSQDQMEEYLETIDEDLYHLEDDFYEGEVHSHRSIGDEETAYLEVDCPECGETVLFDSDIVDDEDVIEVTCPSCDTVVFTNDDDVLMDEEPDVIEGHSYSNSKDDDAI
ncbi:CD1247 N-terminal domain-containing protein [Desulfolucanica intricata]|uniref:CD1247 N-terminal domain-containing protein n=1 Tax=Desulfolucanica intricata TaxID=1285191 RepID=UPI000830EB94|nr:CD1247 N-terminal domain-containing protein [Desulfolucanica intricata]